VAVSAPFTIALRSLGRRKVRMALIGLLVVIGTVLIVFGGTVAASAQIGSKQAIVGAFTGDLVFYSAKSKDLPSPFSFTTPLPPVENGAGLETWLTERREVAQTVGIAQNYGLISVEKDGRKLDLSFLFYAVDPVRYEAAFHNLDIRTGDGYGAPGSGSDRGILLSTRQHRQYVDKYGIDLKPGDKVTLLSVTGGGAVNAVSTTVRGIFEPRRYANVFSYVNFMDIRTYGQLYNFTGVAAGGLPSSLDSAFAASSEDDIFALAGTEAFDKLDVGALKTEELTGYTMVSVKLKAGASADTLIRAAGEAGFEVKTAPWDKASSFFSSIAGILQAVIFGMTLLIFLIVVFILMNTLIINILERTPEIGTYRALGADKSFVSAIFLWESLILNFGAALVGIVVSMSLVGLIGPGGIVLPDIVSQYLVGGGPLHLVVTPGPLVTGLVLVLVVSLTATAYPIRVAVSVPPLQAMGGK
jgi:ABC-type lipoprotein release transport system permease subunit